MQAEMASSVYVRAVQRAVELAGSRDALAKHLGVARAQVDEWLAEGRKPTMPMLLRTVEFILDETAPDDPAAQA